MAKADGLVVYVAGYDTLDEATEDFEAIKAAKGMHFLGDYESALFEKTDDGEVRIVNTDATERTFGAKAGAITGAVIGLLFPPTMLGMAAAGAGVGAVAGNLMRGLKRDDLKAMGELLDAGTAGVVLIGETTIEEGAQRLMKRAEKVVERQIDADTKDLTKAMREAARA